MKLNTFILEVEVVGVNQSWDRRGGKAPRAVAACISIEQ